MSPTTEDLLREVLAEEAGTATPAPAVWEAVRVEGAARRARRGRTRLLGAAAAAAVAVVLVVALSDGSEPKGVETVDNPPSTTAPMPDEIVVAVDGSLVVLDSRNGEERRVLLDGPGPITRLSAAPDGRSIFYMGPGGNPCGEGLLSRLDVTSGATEAVAPGAWGTPVISPDGRWLAFATAPCATDPPGVEVVDMRDGGVFDLPLELPAPESSPLPLGFDGSDDLLVGFLVDADPTTVTTIDTAGREWMVGYRIDLAEARASSFDEVATVPVSLPHGWTHLAVLPGGRAALARTSAVLVAEWSAEPRRLFAFADSVEVRGLAADRSGRHLLVLTGDRAVDGAGVYTIWRWSEGDADPQLLATFGSVSDMSAITWLPAPGTGVAPETTVSAPVEPLAADEIVAVTGDGRLVVLDGADGGELRQIADDLDRVSEEPEAADRIDLGEVGAITVTLSPDRKSVFHDGQPEAACGDGQFVRVIRRVSVDGADREDIGRGREPAISPDGNRLALLRSADGCVGPVELVVRDLVAGSERSWTLPDDGDVYPRPGLTGPLSWDADSRHVLVSIAGGGVDPYFLVDTDLGGPTIGGTPIPNAGLGSPVALRFLGVTGWMAGIAPRDSFGVDSVIATVDPSTGDRDEVIVAGVALVREELVAFDADAAGERLLVLTATGELLRVDLDANDGDGDVEPGFSAVGIIDADW